MNMNDRVELPELEVRRWDGEEWPEKRISIAAVDHSGGPSHALFINARYADLDEALRLAEEYSRRCNAWDKVKAKLQSAIELSIAGFDDNAVDLAEQALQIMEGEQC